MFSKFWSRSRHTNFIYLHTILQEKKKCILKKIISSTLAAHSEIDERRAPQED